MESSKGMKKELHLLDEMGFSYLKMKAPIRSRLSELTKLTR